MEPEDSLLYSLVPATCPYPEPDQASPCPHLTSYLILSSHIRLGLPSSLVPSGFPTKTLYTSRLSAVRATYPVHLIRLDLITRTMLVEEYSTVQYSTVQYNRVQYSTAQYSTVQYSTVQHSTVQYSTIQYSTVQHSTVQHSTVQYSTTYLYISIKFNVHYL